MIENINKNTFEIEILNGAKIKVVEIYTNSCPNCKTLEPILEQTAKENNERYNFYKLDAQKNIEIAKQYKVLGVPTLLFFKYGKLVDKKTGVLQQQQMEQRLLKIDEYSEEIASKKEITGYFKLPWK